MSTLTYLTSLVQQAISRLNNYEANAKKVDELPHQTTLEPTSKLPVSRGGISEHVTVQQIISSIQNSNYNQLLAVGTIIVDGTDIIIPSGVSGQINGLLYGTSTDTTIPIVLCEAGFNRKDILVLTTSNTVVVISGEETDGAIVLAPPVPTDAVYITEFDVNDTSIGTPIDPSLGTQFKKKSESAAYNDPTLSGSNAVIQFQPNGESVYAFSNAGLVSIDGFGLDLITGNPSAEVPYPGKDIFIFNNKSGNLTLKHDGSGTAQNKFFFIDETDLIIPPGGKVWLKYGPSYCELIFKSWTDLSNKADLVAGKVPASQLPSYVDDVLEFADLAAFPVTGETGKIYLALDTNKTYRWSGSAYVQIGGGANKQIFHWWGGNWTTTTLNLYYYISHTNRAIETLPGNTGTTISASMQGRNQGLFIAPFNCKIKRVIFKEGGSGSYTGAFVLASGLPNYGGTWNIGYSNIVTHLNQAISATGYEQRKNEFLVTDNITIPKGYAVCPMLVFSAQAQAGKNGVEISVEIEEVV